MASAMIEIEKFKNLLKKKHKLAVFVDGPNVLRRDVNLSLREIKENLKTIGLIKICRVYLNQNAPSKLVEAAINEGYEVVTTPSDVDVCMAVDATSAIYNPAVNVIALVTRDTDFHFVLKKAKEMGKATIVVGAKENFSSALRNTADEAILLEGMKESREMENKGRNNG
ncbi:MAG: NYN domain-containing protein [Candidatus Altiarchaeales archaeon HGW-Altiarchaeales-2]|nr:MAG: NYN domain-containing protein [Candidatus Altiarchaeales archaeon HGW-Altiarchaeales-2]